MRRRRFLEATGVILVDAGVSACGAGAGRHGVTAGPTAGSRRGRSGGRSTPFLHGVASGDPLADRVVIWTRAQPADDQAKAVEVRYWCAYDAAGRDRVAEGTALAAREHDYTVSVDVRDLAPGRRYYYAFETRRFRSPVGRTRTLPAATDHARFAVASCSNYAWGFFNGYARIAEYDNLDAVLHLGDYIYEYEPGLHDEGAKLGRVPDPPHELISLDDYRRRYAQYRSDPDLMAAHARHPFICVWDDHESANDAWKAGAQNHNAGEGDWEARRAAAVQAYREWMPIRPPEPGVTPAQIYRSFRFGDLCDLMMLDGRIIGRDKQVDRDDVARLADPTRSMLGEAQEAWLYGELARSKADGIAWRLIGQQTMMGQLMRPQGVANADQWDGYAPARARLFDAIERGGISDVVVFTGDIHSSWAVDLARTPFDRKAYDPATGRGALAVEMICPGISSPTPYRGELAKYPAMIRKTHPHVHYLEGTRRGYLIVDVNRERVRGEWHLLPTVERRTPEQVLDAAYEVARGTPHLVRVD